MCSGLECFPSRFEVRARGSADVYDVRFGRAQQFCQGRIAGCVGQRRQLMAGRIVLVVNAYDAVWRGHSAEGVKVEPSHVPGPNKCDAKRLHGWRQVQDMDPGISKAMGRGALRPCNTAA